MYEVREALEIELPALVELGEKWHQESAFRHMDYNVNIIRGLLHAALSSSDLFLHVIVEKSSGKIVGGMLAALQRTFFGNDRVANDMMLGIDKEHRGKCINALVVIVNKYREWAVDNGALRIYLGTSTGVDPEKTEKTFEMLGFRRIGTLHEA